MTENGFEFTYSDPFSADGLLIPGGGDVTPCLYSSAAKNYVSDIRLDVTELYLLKRFISSGKPVLGICRGLQVVNVFFGGTLKNVEGHIQSGEDKRVFCKFTGLLRDLFGASGFVNCRHHQAIDRLGDGLNAVATAKDGVIEAVVGNKLIATQFHPERTPDDGFIRGGDIFKLYKSFFY